jgi:hypothetical protein
MTSLKKSRTLRIHKMTHLGQKMRSTLFRLARVQNGLVLKDKKKSFFNIMNVVLVAIISVMPKIISSICLILY